MHRVDVASTLQLALCTILSAQLIILPSYAWAVDPNDPPIPPEMQQVIYDVIEATGFKERVVYDPFSPASVRPFDDQELDPPQFEETLETPEQRLDLNANNMVYNQQVDFIFFELSVNNLSSNPVSITVSDPRNGTLLLDETIPPGEVLPGTLLEVDYFEDPNLPLVAAGLTEDFSAGVIVEVSSSPTTAGFNGAIGTLAGTDTLRGQLANLTVADGGGPTLTMTGVLPYSRIRIGNMSDEVLSFHIDQGAVRHDMPGLLPQEATPYLTLSEDELVSTFSAAVSWGWAMVIVLIYAIVTCLTLHAEAARIAEQAGRYNVASDLQMRGLGVSLIYHGENPGTPYFYADGMAPIPTMSFIGYLVLTLLLLLVGIFAVRRERRRGQATP